MLIFPKLSTDSKKSSIKFQPGFNEIEMSNFKIYMDIKVFKITDTLLEKNNQVWEITLNNIISLIIYSN